MHAQVIDLYIDVASPLTERMLPPCGQIHINPCFDALTFRKSSLGSSSKGMGVYQHGLGAAFTTQMKVYHLGRRAFVPAEAILRARLGCCTGISHES